MSNGLQPYPEYKDSGVPWLGAIPTHWEVRPLKHWVKINERVLHETTSRDYRFRYIEIGSVEAGRLIKALPSLRFSEAPSRARRILRRGDTIVSTVRTYLKAVYFIAEDDNLIASTGFVVFTPSRRINPKFLSLLAQSDAFINRISANSVGTSYPAIAETRLASFHVSMPPLNEQDAIVRFLDHADRRIRRYIRAKRKLIALLNEQKQVIIQNAVTRGLDPNVPMKDSGVEWLGEIPAHWNVTKLKRITYRLAGRLIVQPHQYFVDEGIPIVFAYNVKPGKIIQHNLKRISFEADERFAHCRVRAGDLLTIRVGYPGTTAVVPPELDGCHFASTMLIRQSPSFYSPWLSFVMNSQIIQDQVNLVNYGAAQKQFNIGDAANFLVPFPPIKEQQIIADTLIDHIEPFDTAIDMIQAEIELGREFLTKLVADVVTGKLDVREAARHLPDDAGDEPDEYDDEELLTEAADFEESAGGDDYAD